MSSVKLTQDEAYDIWQEENEDWESIPGTSKMVDQRRWVTVFEEIYRHIPTDKTYRFCYELGSTECQENDPFIGDQEFAEVELRDAVVKKWMPVEDV